MSATIASAIGISIATNVRNTISSTMIAASRPSTSEAPCSSGGNSASPLNSTVTPAGSTVSRTASCTATTASRSLVLDRLVELRLGVGDAAVVGERVLAERIADARRCRPCSSVGLNSAVLSRATAFAIAALRAGVSSRSPSGAAKTRLRTPPCSDANSASIRSVALCVSEPGISNSSRRRAADRGDEDDQVAMMPTQPKTTRHGCAAQARIQRASAPVARRSCAARRSVVPFSSCCVMSLRPPRSESRPTLPVPASATGTANRTLRAGRAG